MGNTLSPTFRLPARARCQRGEGMSSGRQSEGGDTLRHDWYGGSVNVPARTIGGRKVSSRRVSISPPGFYAEGCLCGGGRGFPHSQPPKITGLGRLPSFLPSTLLPDREGRNIELIHPAYGSLILLPSFPPARKSQGRKKEPGSALGVIRVFLVFSWRGKQPILGKDQLFPLGDGHEGLRGFYLH
jgi:hypothetical protein